MPSALRSQLLRGVDELDRVADGALTLARGARSAGVRAVQRGLLHLGYALRGGADGIFGKATEAALGEFRDLHRRLGAAIVDAPTLALLDASLLRDEAVDAYALQSARFADDGVLARVLDGRTILPRRGESVARIQAALHDLHFSLPRWGADGALGNETRTALAYFQRWQGIRPGGELSPLTLMALDQLAPAPGSRAIRDPDYGALIRDGVLSVTVGMGYDEAGNDLRELGELRQGLLAEGFIQTGSTASDSVHIFTRVLAIRGANATMRVRLVSRHTASPEERFADGLIGDAVTIYSGHARYGTGPDFDDKESSAENFVIGVGAPQHLRGELEPGYNPHMNQILAGVPNDLITRRFDPERYQLWAFLGCTTRHYLDELRALVEGKDTQNLDLLISTRPIYWSDSAFYPLAIVRALLRGESVDAITRALCEQAVATERRRGEEIAGDAFIDDGFGDNAPGWRP
ncbi:MAG: peptidoglycan-binding protein [Myxococcales bacterium]|nr:peptidoglycan-binding protein [Myxococcales bacterium]